MLESLVSVHRSPYMPFNNVEGHRFRLGAKTNHKFSQKFFAKGYVAYGTKDETFKYYLRTEARLLKKTYTILGAQYKKDLDQVGGVQSI